MKAQFFILGAVLICALFFVGLPFYGPQVQTYRKDLSLVSNNLESEFPKALNLALKSGTLENLADFSRFTRNTLAGQNIGVRILWVVAEPQGSDVQVTVGNFMNGSQSVSITVEGSGQVFDVPENSTLARVFPGVLDSFQISIQFPGHSKTSTWLRGKVSLYAFMEDSRGNDIVAEEISG
jgi:hypothetical protein